MYIQCDLQLAFRSFFISLNFIQLNAVYFEQFHISCDCGSSGGALSFAEIKGKLKLTKKRCLRIRCNVLIKLKFSEESQQRHMRLCGIELYSGIRV